MVMLLLLLLSGDIETNPGPLGEYLDECVTHKWYECTYCYYDFYIEAGKSIHSIELSYHSTFHGEKTIDYLI